MTNKEKYEANKAYAAKQLADKREKTARVNAKLEALAQSNRATGKVIDKDHPLAPTYDLELIPKEPLIYKEKDYTPRRRIMHG